MVVRVLCLHGQGVNSTIFQRQTAYLREMLPRDYDFCFFDGAYECEPAPGVLDFFSPPYMAWYKTPTTKNVLDAHCQVRRMVERHGPFDAVLGFSQGAAVAASLLLHDELQGLTPTFRAAIFIGSPVPFSHHNDVGIDARTYFGIGSLPPNQHGRPTVVPPNLVADRAYLRNPAQLDGAATSEGVQYQMFHASTDSVRIRVPTDHIFGSQDKWLNHSRDLVDLCCADGRTVFQHDGGHEVPRQYTEELCDVVETVFAAMAAPVPGTEFRT